MKLTEAQQTVVDTLKKDRVLIVLGQDYSTKKHGYYYVDTTGVVHGKVNKKTVENLIDKKVIVPTSDTSNYYKLY